MAFKNRLDNSGKITHIYERNHIIYNVERANE